MDNVEFKHADNFKHLGCTFSFYMLRQLRNVYTKSNRLLRIFHSCFTGIKIALFRSYYTCFYYLFLCTHYTKSTHNKLRVAANNVYCRIRKGI